MGMNQDNQKQNLSPEVDKAAQDDMTREDARRYLATLSEVPSYN
jgi:hypothetical protein